MKNKEKIITLVLLAIIAYVTYFFYKKQTQTAQDAAQEAALSNFNQSLSIWESKIRKAIIDPTYWPELGWYRAPGYFRDKALSTAREAALWQIAQNEPQIIPEGYQIIDNGDKLAFLKKY